ncbi:adenylate/guanylate cyclase domain-containing protein [Beggiatoa leptomitoformis]|uniref:AAA family ATPase n=1 Tax=Beggiatoa leptomitoformis TaxID=288004 RepID=A0A2N9YEK8_9GAMM|nr:adenylate/guanylate cyclase domain-containing protein [Beggiatoa leptomitoformis]ALG68843.1 AAA family ATPase [Beggiatoa leptomitoformis]AUI68789.1 AAA family ATPase [Beggiatoa leptomitoformis]
MSSTSLQTLISYTPTLVQRHYAMQPNWQPTPHAEHLHAVSLFIDIYGLTPLAEQLLEQGSAGYTSLTNLLNVYIGHIIDIITEHGGEVLKFSGDALLVLWPVGVTGKDLTTVARRAAFCALELQAWQQTNPPAALPQLSTNNPFTHIGQAALTGLSLRILLDAGDIWSATVGGAEGQWELFVAGAPLLRLSTAQRYVQPNEVIIAPTAWQSLQRHCKGEILENHYIRLDSINRPLKPRYAPTIELLPETADCLRRYISPIILARLDIGQTHQLAELQQVSVLFLNIEGLDYHKSTVLTHIQDALYELQQTVLHFSGQIIQFLINDSGTLFIAAWGVSLDNDTTITDSIEKNAFYAIQSAQTMRIILHDQQLRGSIGISTGQVFCGNRGNAKRCHFDLIGMTMQRAAHLMQAAHDTIFCDSASYRASQAFLDFEPLPALQLPASTITIPVYRPLTRKKGSPHHPFHTDMIGRRQERQFLTRQLQTFQQGENGNTILIEAEEGLGKTLLCEDLLQQIGLPSLVCLYGSASATEKAAHIANNPYGIWRQLFNALLNYEMAGARVRGQPAEAPEVSAEFKMAAILGRLQSKPALLSRLPLLNIILSLNLPDNKLTSQMQGKVREENTQTLICALLKDILRRSKNRYLIIIDDIHLLDSASYALLYHVSRQVQPLLLILTSLPITPITGEKQNSQTTDYAQSLSQYSGTRHLRLKPLNIQETHALACRRLGVTRFTIDINDWLYAKTNGNPLLIEELAYTLQATTALRNIDGICHVSPTLHHELQTKTTQTILQKVIAERITQLPSPQQLTLETASVMGQTFNLNTLHGIYPIVIEKAELLKQLENLQKNLFTAQYEYRRYRADKNSYYLFKHTRVQQAAYQQLSSTYCIKIHHSLATWYETLYADNLTPYYPVLAHHWANANVLEKAIFYLEKAGEHAFRHYANKEAIHFFRQAITFDEKQAVMHSSSTQQAKWALYIGEAYFNLGQFTESRQFLKKALKALKEPLPQTRIGLSISLCQQICVQAWHLLFPIRLQTISTADSEHLLQTAQIYERLSSIAWIEQNVLLGLQTELKSLNLAENAQQSSAVLIKSYANLCLATGGFALNSLAELYSKRTTNHHIVPNGQILFLLSIHDLRQGRWQLSQAQLLQALLLAERVGDSRQQMENLNQLFWLHYFQAEWSEAIKKARSVYAIAHQQNDIQARVWGLCGQALGYLRLGELDNAIECLKSVQAMPSEEMKVTEATIVCGVLGLVYSQQGLTQKAIQMATKTAHLLAKQLPNTTDIAESYASVAQLYLQQWENAPNLSAKEYDAFSELSKRACRAFTRYANVFPILKSRAYLWEGLYAWLSGHSKRAHQHWQYSLEQAQLFNLPYEKALAHYEIARHLLITHPQRDYHLKEAQQGFTQLQAKYDMVRVKKLWKNEDTQ